MAAVLPEQTVPTEAYIVLSSAVFQRHGAVPGFPAGTVPAARRKESALQCYSQYAPCGEIPAVPDSRPAGNR